jgi:predicted AlkP superfamily phosphohydrolase/phosphomutase
MRTFALPSFYDGRVRVNLAGREEQGIVARRDYEAVLDEVTALVSDCVDTRTGQPVVARVERYAGDPQELGASDADLVVVWNATPAGFRHPRFGTIGPVPYRRTGGHTGAYGFAFVSGAGVGAGDAGIVSSVDVAPTIVDLLGAPPVAGLSGTSLLARADT